MKTRSLSCCRRMRFLQHFPSNTNMNMEGENGTKSSSVITRNSLEDAPLHPSRLASILPRRFILFWTTLQIRHLRVLLMKTLTTRAMLEKVITLGIVGQITTIEMLSQLCSRIQVLAPTTHILRLVLLKSRMNL